MGGMLKEGGDDFSRAFDCAFTHMQGVAHDALNAAAVALGGGLTMDDLAPLLDPSPLPYGHASASYLSAVKYYAPVEETDVGHKLLAQDHVDGGLLTILYSTDDGLQVNRGDGWKCVRAPPEGAGEESCRLVVLVGAQLERATGGALKAVLHRVVAQRTGNGADEEADVGVKSRRSLVFRLRARHTAVLDPLKLAPKIELDMPMLTALASRAPISVADFEKAFAESHRSINYVQQQRQEENTPMQMVVERLTGASTTYEIFPNDTVEDLRAKIQEQTGIPFDVQVLIWNGSRLEGNRRLSRYGVTNNAVVHLILDMRGD